MATKSPAPAKTESAPTLNVDRSNLLQRKCACGNAASLTGKCSECERDRLSFQRTTDNNSEPSRSSPVLHEMLGFPGAVQTKLTINEPGDQYEQEADRVADQVMRSQETEEDLKTNSRLQPQTPSIRPYQTENRSIHRQTEDLEVEDEKEKLIKQREDEEETIQMKSFSGLSPMIHSKLPAQLAAIQSGGRSLPETTREFMESRFAHNFSSVQIHTDSQAAAISRQLNAKAFTHGQHVYFGSGQYQPDTSAGQLLLAHELTHVVQQTGGSKHRSQLPSWQRPPQAQSDSEHETLAFLHAPFHPIISPTANTIQKQEEESILGSIASFVGIDITQYLDQIPGYTLFTVIIEYDPIRDSPVERTGINLVQGLLGLLGPIGNNIFAALQEHETLQQAFDWIETELFQRNLSRERFLQTLSGFPDVVLDALPTSLGAVLQLAQLHFGSLIRDIESFARSLIDQLIEQIKAVAIDLAEGLLDENPAWDLIKKVLHYDALKDEEVTAPTVEILEDFLRLIGKEVELEQMRERGTLQETADWLDTQLGTFSDLLQQLTNLFAEAWNAIQPENLPNLSSNLQSLANRAFEFLRGVGEFALTIALQVLEIIKNALLGLLREHASTIPGYHLLTVMVGKDIFTDEEVPLTPTNLIRGFMSLMPGGEAQFQQMNETGVIPEAAQRIETAMTELGISWEFVKQLFLGIWNSLTIEDMVTPIDTFIRVLNEFGEPISRLFTFVIEVIKVLLELVLVLMNFPTDLIGSIITNSLQALDDIQRDPVGFLINLLETMKLGFQKFFDNIVEHLISGLTNWLFSTVREAGIEPPTDLTFESILGFVLDILGLSMDHLWELLANHIGQDTVDQIRGAIDQVMEVGREAWGFIQDVEERGMVAIWEYIESQLTNLWSVVLEQVSSWVMVRIILVGTRWLLSLLDASGITPTINGFIAFFQAVQSAIEYLREILEVINDFVTTVASIARGELEPGAERMEQGLSNSLPIVIGFLANQFGLGGIGAQLQEIIADVREMVDAALNWLIEQALRLGRNVLRSLGLGGDSQQGDRQDEPIDAHGDSNRSPIVRSFDFLGEDHSLRLGITADGDVRVTMASESWGDFPQVLAAIKEQQVLRLRGESRTYEATELERELQTLIDEAITTGALGGSVQQARLNHQRQLNNVPPTQQRAWLHENGNVTDAMMAVWDEHYNNFSRRLQELDTRYDFSDGRRGVIALGNDFVDRNQNTLMKVSGVNVRQNAYYGIKAYPANATSSSQDSFYSYDAYSATGSSGWGPMGSVPPLLPYPSSGISPTSLAWRSATRHVVINDATRRLGTPANSSEAVPGVLSISVNPSWKYVARGHFIANVLGGPGHYLSGNIVPMTVNANNSQMKTKLENRVLDLFEDDPFKNDPLKQIVVDIQVTPTFWDATGTTPLSVQVQYQKKHPTPEPVVTDTVSNL